MAINVIVLTSSANPVFSAFSGLKLLQKYVINFLKYVTMVKLTHQKKLCLLWLLTMYALQISIALQYQSLQFFQMVLQRITYIKSKIFTN